MPLFTLARNMTEGEFENIGHSYIIDSIEYHIHESLAGAPETNELSMIYSKIKEILKDQKDVNDLSTELCRNLKFGATASKPISDEHRYKHWKKQKHNQTHVDIVKKSLSKIKKTHEKVYKKFEKIKKRVVEAKKKFSDDTEVLVIAITEAVFAHNRMNILHNFITVYRGLQSTVNKRLVDLENILTEFSIRQKALAHFLMGVRPCFELCGLELLLA